MDVVNTSRTDAIYPSKNISEINISPKIINVIVINIWELRKPTINPPSIGKIRKTAKLIITFKFIININM